MDRNIWNKKKQLLPNDKDQGFPANTRLDAIRYKYSSKEEEGDLPFTINIFNSSKGSKKVIAVQVELNIGSPFRLPDGFDSLVLAFNMNGPVDLEPVKRDHGSFSLDQQTHVLYWTVGALKEGDQAVFSFASEALDFEGMFPIEVKFEETHSILGLEVTEVVNSETQEPMSLKSICSLMSERYQVCL